MLLIYQIVLTGRIGSIQLSYDPCCVFLITYRIEYYQPLEESVSIWSTFYKCLIAASDIYVTWCVLPSYGSVLSRTTWHHQ